MGTTAGLQAVERKKNLALPGIKPRVNTEVPLHINHTSQSHVLHDFEKKAAINSLNDIHLAGIFNGQAGMKLP
jgi:hypothetical protein